MAFCTDCGALLTVYNSKGGRHVGCRPDKPREQKSPYNLEAQISLAIKSNGRTSSILGGVLGAGQLSEQQFIDIYLQAVNGQVAGFAKVILQTRKDRNVHDAYAHPLYVFEASHGGLSDFEISSSKIFCTCSMCDIVSRAHLPAIEAVSVNRAAQRAYSMTPPARSLADKLKGYFFVKYVAWPEFEK
ncbi:MAG: hypothetical protein HYT16_01220 [DPANN group archaeon]|nr:hypothetical protein [DPANN group archaeon]